MLNQLSPAYLLPEGNWFNLSYDSITSVSVSPTSRRFKYEVLLSMKCDNKEFEVERQVSCFLYLYHMETWYLPLNLKFLIVAFHVYMCICDTEGKSHRHTYMKCCYKRVNCSLWYLVPTCYMGTIGNKLVPGITVWTVWFTLLYQHFIAVPGTTVKLTLS